MAGPSRQPSLGPPWKWVVVALVSRQVREVEGVSAGFDCKMRRLALEFGRELVPRHGSFQALAAALSTAECELNETAVGVEGSSPTKKSPLIRAVGRRFSSVQAACDAAAAADDASEKVVEVSGRHELSEPVVLTSRHSGVTIRGGELSGGVQLAGLEWKEHTTGEKTEPRRGTSRARFPGSSSELKTWAAEVDLAAYGLEEVPGLQIDGRRRTRARYPNMPGGIEVSCGWGCVIDGKTVEWSAPESQGGETQYTDEVHVRNDTTDGWFQEYTIGMDGACAVYDPPVSYWCSTNSSGGGAFTYRTPAGVSLNRTSLPNAPYATTEGLEFHVYRPGRWANWMFTARELEEGHFKFLKGGFQGARGDDVGGDFFVENVFEELDVDLEFYFDTNTSTLYLVSEEAPSPNASIVVPKLRTLVNASGTRSDPVVDVTFEDVSFTATRTTYMDTHAVPSAGDWALARVGAVFVQGSEGFTVRNCTFDRLDSGSALMISGYSRGFSVLDSDFSYLGGSAIASWGYTNESDSDPGRPGVHLQNAPYAGIDGSDSEHPAFTLVKGNVAREIGLYEKQASFYVQAKTRFATIAGNVFFNGPRAGVNFNDGFGGGDVLARNLIFSTCRETQDHGPTNSWDRQPFMIDGNLTMAWRQITRNFMIDNFSPQEDVDQDDGSAYFDVHHNALVYGQRAMKNDFGGHDNHHHDNVYAYVNQAVNLVKTLPGHQDMFYNNKVIFNTTDHDPDFGNPVCDGDAPTIVQNNSYYTPSGTLTECGSSLSDWQANGGDPLSTVSTLPSDDDLVSWLRAVLQMPPSSSSISSSSSSGAALLL